MIEREDIDMLENRFDDRYVRRTVCDEKQEAVNRKFANDDKRLELLGRDVGLFKKLAWVLVSASVGQLVIMFFDLIKNAG